jgi:hypothetical protein
MFKVKTTSLEYQSYCDYSISKINKIYLIIDGGYWLEGCLQQGKVSRKDA